MINNKIWNQNKNNKDQSRTPLATPSVKQNKPNKKRQSKPSTVKNSKNNGSKYHVAHPSATTNSPWYDKHYSVQ